MEQHVDSHVRGVAQGTVDTGDGCSWVKVLTNASDRHNRGDHQCGVEEIRPMGARSEHTSQNQRV